jgi:hypothetical protein
MHPIRCITSLFARSERDGSSTSPTDGNLFHVVGTTNGMAQPAALTGGIHLHMPHHSAVAFAVDIAAHICKNLRARRAPLTSGARRQKR